MNEACDAASARRLARSLISDLVAYAGEEIRIGLEKDDLFDRLGREIERSRVFYLHHVNPSVSGRNRFFDHALVDGLVAAHREVQSFIW